jgi:hypothetical protein
MGWITKFVWQFVLRLWQISEEQIMSRQLKLVFDGEVFRLAAPIKLPPKEYLVTFADLDELEEIDDEEIDDGMAASRQAFVEMLRRHAGSIEGMPLDWSSQHNHYLYGAAKSED